MREQFAVPATDTTPSLFGVVSRERGTRSLLVLRFTLFNLIAMALLGAAALQGWVMPVFSGYTGWAVGGIALIFIVGLVWCGRLIHEIARELDQVRSGEARRGSRVFDHYKNVRGAAKGMRRAHERALTLKLKARISGPRHIAGSLVFLGLIGTVVGFMIALSGVDPAQAGDPSAVAPMVGTLIDGMGLALSTTLVGAVLNLWLTTCWRMLEHGTAKLLAELLERGGCDT